MSKLILVFSLLIMSCNADEEPLASAKLYMIGDSTMCNWSEKYEPETGWGQVFQEFFIVDLTVDNRAKSGKSTKSFREEGFWDPVLEELMEGDFVIIQFGHNDSKKGTSKYADPHTSYRENLIRYVEEVRAKGAYPILCTPIARRRFTEDGFYRETHGDYPDAVRYVSGEFNVPLLDLHRKTVDLLIELGPEESKSLFLYTQPGVYSNWPNGTEDNTHLNPYGARKVASLAVMAIKEENVALEAYLN